MVGMSIQRTVSKEDRTEHWLMQVCTSGKPCHQGFCLEQLVCAAMAYRCAPTKSALCCATNLTTAT